MDITKDHPLSDLAASFEMVALTCSRKDGFPFVWRQLALEVVLNEKDELGHVLVTKMEAGVGQLPR